MKKLLAMLISVITMLCTSITALSYGWQGSGETGWWYGTNAENTSWCSDGWNWIDDNGDNYAECYYFKNDGYILLDGQAPDGSIVNKSGQWVVDGVVQSIYVGAEQTQQNTAETQAEINETQANNNKTGVSVEDSYIGNRNSKIFHRQGCASVGKMKDSNKVGLSSRDSALSNGYRPCKNCNP
ncbi:MAG: hypothetical protein MR011_02765 [Lachnospiraceae bacterium]|nr:hypothetical protein [Lachnospiraceae bacterium]